MQALDPNPNAAGVNPSPPQVVNDRCPDVHSHSHYCGLPLPLPENVVRMVPIVLGIYTLITIIGYFMLHTPAQYSTLGLADKAIEIVLIILIGVYLGQQRTA